MKYRLSIALLALSISGNVYSDSLAKIKYVKLDASLSKITIRGKALKGTGNTMVSLGGKKLTILSQSPTFLVAQCPGTPSRCKPGDWSLQLNTYNKENNNLISSTAWDLNIGNVGPKGDTGPAGAAGAQGPKGDTGDTGPAGPKGDAGDTGPAGPQGDAGDAGAQGPKGDTGDRGSQGPAGPQGSPGVIDASRCRIVSNKGVSPNYSSLAQCDQNEFVISGGGRVLTAAGSTDGNNSSCVGFAYGFLHQNMPGADMKSWIVDGKGYNWATDVCTEAFAICCH